MTLVISNMSCNGRNLLNKIHPPPARGSQVSGKRLCVLGLAYKKNTSDTRYSPAWDVCRALLAERAKLALYDPRVAQEAVSLARVAIWLAVDAWSAPDEQPHCKLLARCQGAKEGAILEIVIKKNIYI